MKDRRQQMLLALYPEIVEETKKNEKILACESKRREEKSKVRNYLDNNSLTWLCIKYAVGLDVIDGVVGLIMPGVGDIICSLLNLPCLYLAVYEIKSIPLFLAILKNMTVDWFVGMFPIIGDIIDGVFIHSHQNNAKLVKGFVDDDAAVIKKVNDGAFKACVIIAIVIAIGLWMWSLIFKFISWFVGLF